MASVSSPSDRAFIDTNVLIYAFDRSDPAKRAVAGRLIEDLLRSRRAAVSVQVLNEFYWVVTRPGPGIGMTSAEATLQLSRLARLCQVMPLTVTLTFLGLEARERYQLSFWDSLIWAAAREAGAATLYSEDFQHGQVIEGIHCINPFAPDA